MNKLWIANDHGGYLLKRAVLEHLSNRNVEYVDIGCASEEIVRYPYYASQVASAVSSGEALRGLLICSTGIGMAIIANKYPGVRASVCSSPYEAMMTRAHNDSNILCIGGRTVGDMKALNILDTWLDTDYMGGRHDISLGLIRDVESMNLTGKCWRHDLKDML